MLLALALTLGWVALIALAVVLCAAARRGDAELARLVARPEPA